MKVGIMMLYKRVDESAPNPGAFALECENIGFESVWVGDHMLFHAHPTTPFPVGGPIPDHYAHFPEPFVVLAMAAATTKKLRIGTAVLLVPEHEPLVAAKTIATLDRLSGGRFILGIGTGWLREAAVPLGSDFDHRWTQAAEYVAAMRELWSKPAASFHGKYANFDDIVCNPKPVPQAGAAAGSAGPDRQRGQECAQAGCAMGRRVYPGLLRKCQSSRLHAAQSG